VTEQYWAAWQFLRGWRAPFLSSIEAARAQVAEADALAAKAGAPPVDAVGTDDPDAALAALRDKVAELQRFDDALAARKRLADWIARATPDGPLAGWRADAERRLAEVDEALATAEPDAVVAAVAEIGAALSAVDGVATQVSDAATANRVAAQEAVAAWDEVCRIVRQDVRVMDAKVAALEEGRDAERRLALTTLGFAAFVGLALGAGIGFAVAEVPGTWLGAAVGVCVGLVAGIVAWVVRLRSAARLVDEHLAHARKLDGEAAQAKLEVLAELEALQRKAAEIGASARELRLGDRAADHGDLVARVSSDAGLDELAPFLTRVQVRQPPELALRGAAAVAAVLTACVVAGVWAATVEPAEEAIAEVASEPTVAAEAAPALPVVVEPEAPAPPKPEAPPAFASGAWTGQLGPATLNGTLTARGSAVSGTFRLDGPDGVRECGARGKLTGARIWLTVDGCASQISLEGKVTDGGARIRGTGTSTIEFQGRQVAASDTWTMAAAP
jgi:hypothetical protein